MIDKSKLIPKKVRDKNGKLTTVWIRVGESKKQREQNLKDFAIYGDKFKAWFGDWQNKKGSKVVKKNGEPAENYNISKAVDVKGQPVKIFHGTAVGGFKEFETKKIGGYNLWGKGFYFTESKRIANEYTEKDNEEVGGEATGILFNGKKVDYLPNSVVEAWKDEVSFHGNKHPKGHKEYNPYLHDKYNSKNHTMYSNPNWDYQLYEALTQAETSKGVNVKKFLEIYRSEKLKYHEGSSMGERRYYNPDTIKRGLSIFFNYPEIKKEGVKPFIAPSEVIEVYLNIRKPLDMTKMATEESVKDIVKTLKDDLYWKNFDRGELLWEKSQSGDLTLDYLIKIKDKYSKEVFDKDYEWMGEVVSKKGDKVHRAFELSPKGQMTIEEVFFIMSDMRKYGAVARLYANRKGMDGMAHTGGWSLRGATKADNHKVWVCFNPTQIKSTNAKKFDGKDNNFYKSE